MECDRVFEDCWTEDSEQRKIIPTFCLKAGMKGEAPSDHRDTGTIIVGKISIQYPHSHSLQSFLMELRRNIHLAHILQRVIMELKGNTLKHQSSLCKVGSRARYSNPEVCKIHSSVWCCGPSLEIKLEPPFNGSVNWPSIWRPDNPAQASDDYAEATHSWLNSLSIYLDDSTMYLLLPFVTYFGKL